MENLIIVGSGPAGLTAAIYAARADLAPLVFEGPAPGGQLVVSHEVENYPGFEKPLSGTELMARFRKQAQRFGTRFRSAAVEHVAKADHILKVQAADEVVETRALIIATGAQARRLPIPSEKQYYGKGVSGCATCDGFFHRNKNVIVVGGGNSAMEDAVLLTRFASKVIIVHRRAYLRADAIEVDKARTNPKIEWMIPWVVDHVLGNDLVTGARLRNPETGQEATTCDMEHAVNRQALERFVCFLAFIQRDSPAGVNWLDAFRRFIQEGADGRSCEQCVKEYMDELRLRDEG